VSGWEGGINGDWIGGEIVLVAATELVVAPAEEVVEDIKGPFRAAKGGFFAGGEGALY